jgi:sugar phosphate isomerase/epimerase
MKTNQTLAFLGTLLLAALTCGAAEASFTLALQAYTFRDRTMVETIEVAKRLGFKAIELTPTQQLGGAFKGAVRYSEMSPETVAAVRTYLENCGLKVLSYGVVNESDEAGWRKQFEFVRALGIGMLLVEPSIEQLPILDRLAQEYKIRVMIHNHTKTSPWWDPAFMAAKVAGCSEYIGAGADIGHWPAAGVKPVEGIEKLMTSRIFGLHFVDVDRVSPEAHAVPYGTGVAQLREVMNALKAKGLNVQLTCEYEYQSDRLEQDVRSCVTWFEANVPK